MNSPISFLNLGQCPNCNNSSLNLITNESIKSKINTDGTVADHDVVSFKIYLECSTCNTIYSVIKQGNYYAPTNKDIERLRNALLKVKQEVNTKNPFYGEEV